MSFFGFLLSPSNAPNANQPEYSLSLQTRQPIPFCLCLGEDVPMPAAELSTVQRVLFNAHAQLAQRDTSGGREPEKIKQSLNDLIKQLQTGVVTRVLQEFVVQYCRGICGIGVGCVCVFGVLK